MAGEQYTKRVFTRDFFGVRLSEARVYSWEFLSQDPTSQGFAEFSKGKPQDKDGLYLEYRGCVYVDKCVICYIYICIIIIYIY